MCFHLKNRTCSITNTFQFSQSPEMAAAASPVFLSWASTLPKQLNEQNPATTVRCTSSPTFTVSACSRETTVSEKSSSGRRAMLFGAGTLAANIIPAKFALAEEVPKNYSPFVDALDGYSYYYPSDWREFDFMAHDSAFKDRYLQLQNLRLSFMPTDKIDIHDLGPMEDVIFNVVRHRLAAPTQKVTIFDMQERTVDGKNYYTFEYDLTSTNFSRTAFATIAIGNGRYYTLIVGANGRRWKKVRNQLKVVADSFKILDI